MKAHLRYGKYVVLHKWYVFLACLHYRVPLHQALVHDWSKFTPREWGPYVDQFYGTPPPPRSNPRFNAAMLRHVLDNAHHWQHYVMVQGSGPRRWNLEQFGNGEKMFIALLPYDTEPNLPKRIWLDHTDLEMGGTQARIDKLLIDANRPEPIIVPMPERFIREMVADWTGAGRAQGAGRDPRSWYTKNRDKMLLHPFTRHRVEQLIDWRAPEVAVDEVVGAAAWS